MNIQRSAERLTKASELVRETKLRLRENRFTLETWTQPTGRLAIQQRESFLVMLNAVHRNLDVGETDPLRSKYPDLFHQAHNLRGKCTLLRRKCDATDVREEINWHDIWHTVTERLPSRLQPLLEDAIEKEKSPL